MTLFVTFLELGKELYLSIYQLQHFGLNLLSEDVCLSGHSVEKPCQKSVRIEIALLCMK